MSAPKSRNKYPQKGKKNAKKFEATWNAVKFDGKVAIHDNADFDGFAGLEILENYDKRMFKKEKSNRDSLNLRNIDRIYNKPDRKQPVVKEKDSGLDSEEDIFELFDENDHLPVKKRKQDEAEVKPKSKKTDKKAPAGRFVLLRPPTPESEDEFDIDEMVDFSGEEVSSENEEESDEEAPNLINVKSWQELGVPEEVLKAIADKGFTSPTMIQTLAIPPAILGKRDILGAAETGSGKTLAFGIPIIDGILKHRKREAEKSKTLFAVILTPTRELASQVHEHMKELAKYTDLKIAPIFGGLAAIKQKRVLKQCPEIVIATPGRLWELIEEGEEHLQKIGDIKYFAVDETDRMVEKGHFDELQKLLGVLNEDEVSVKERQNFIFSATLTMVHDLPDYVLKRSRGGDKPLKLTPGQKIQKLIEAFGASDPKVVDITSETGTPKGLTESRILCPADQKDVYLYYFLQRHPGRTILFCNSIDCVKRLVSLFGYLDCSPIGLHGSMAQRQRLKNIDKFKASTRGLLVATDVAARGLDIPMVQHVIHYQTPKTTENYVHRSGRTARANTEGIAVLLMEPSEVKYYKKLYVDLGRDEDLPIFPVLDRALSIARNRVNLAREVEAIDLRFRRESAEENWSEKVAKEAELYSDNSDADSDDEKVKRNEKSKVKQLFKEKSRQLAQLLAAPMFETITKYPQLTTTSDMGLKKGKRAAENDSAIDAVKQVVAEHKAWKMNRNKKRKVKA